MIEFIVLGLAVVMLLLAYVCFKADTDRHRYSKRYGRGGMSEVEIDATRTKREMDGRVMADREDPNRPRYRSM